MRFLFVSNYLPPYGLGGYEEWCYEMACGLRDRGHDVNVLTSRIYGEQVAHSDPNWIHRVLHLEMPPIPLANSVLFFTHRKQHEQENLDILRQAIAGQRPNVVLFWGMWNLQRSLPALAESLLPGGVSYYIGDYWPALPPQYSEYWQAPARNGMAGWPKQALGTVARRQLAAEKRIDLLFQNCMVPTAYVSDELVRQGVEIGHAKVIPGAVDTTAYRTDGPASNVVEGTDCQLLYVGRLTAEKGIQTALEALAILTDGSFQTGYHLTVAGSGDGSYQENLKESAEQLGIAGRISWLGQQPKESLPALYSAVDIFLFTSIWPEPFGRVIVEAMASGTAIVGSATGGSAELLFDGENCLTFEAGDPADLAVAIRSLADDPALREFLTVNARQFAVENHDIGRMLDNLELALKEIKETAT